MAQEVAAGHFTQISKDTKANNDTFANLPTFCRVVLVARPTQKSQIGIEMWLPLQNWNRRILGIGNGGFAGYISYGALADGLRKGFAVANTDTGTFPKDGFFPFPETVTDWASRSVHLMTVGLRSVANAYYKKAPKSAYFTGCSSGGQEALMEAQRFPEDYNGIVAGAPANDRVDLHIALLWNWKALHDEHGNAMLSPEDLSVLSTAAAKACPSVDGVILQPDKCNFDPDILTCSQESSQVACLSRSQIAAVRKVYEGPINPGTGDLIYPGLVFGSEKKWTLTTSDVNGSMPYLALFRAALRSDWHGIEAFDFDRDTRTLENTLSATVDATSANLDAFHRHGGKLFMSHGWADYVISPEGSIDYADAIKKRYGTDSKSFFRLYLIPGEAHCAGGDGPSNFDQLGAVMAWVEDDKAPGPIVAHDGTKLKEALLCPYPEIAAYSGSGLKDDAQSYSCTQPSLAGERR